MTPEQIEALARGMAATAGGPPWWSYPLMLILAGCGAWFGTYLQEKGKNLATREDVAKITEKVESVKRQHQEAIEDLKANYQLRMVAAERRMQAHQEAYHHWHLMVVAVTSQPETRVDTLKAAQEWYAKNCLFLGILSRAKFRTVCNAVSAYRMLERGAGVDGERFLENWILIESAGNVFLEEVTIPPLKAEDRDIGVPTA